ncbi:MAG: tetratricopeptide repeat protein [Pseudomonadota bacterium]
MIRTALVALALSGSLSVAGVLAPSPAHGQAPVTQAMSSAEISARIQALEKSAADAAQLRQDNARLRLEFRDLQAQLSAANGKADQFLYDLSQAREEIGALKRDNTAIAEALTDITGRLTRLESGFGHSGAPSDPTFPAGGNVPGNPGVTGPSSGTAVTLPAPITPPQPQTRGGPMDLTPTPTQPAAPAAAPEVADQGIELPGDPDALFNFGMDRLSQLDLVGAEAAFSSFLEANPDHERSSEATYWLGDMQFRLGDYASSGRTYVGFLRSYPDDQRAADAFVKLARALRESGEGERACDILGAVPSRYPDASPSVRRLAASETRLGNCSA